MKFKAYGVGANLTIGREYEGQIIVTDIPPGTTVLNMWRYLFVAVINDIGKIHIYDKSVFEP